MVLIETLSARIITVHYTGGSSHASRSTPYDEILLINFMQLNKRFMSPCSSTVVRDRELSPIFRIILFTLIFVCEMNILQYTLYICMLWRLENKPRGFITR